MSVFTLLGQLGLNIGFHLWMAEPVFSSPHHIPLRMQRAYEVYIETSLRNAANLEERINVYVYGSMYILKKRLF